MKVHAGVDKDSGLIYSVVVTIANVHDLNKTADLSHGDKEVVYTDSSCQGIAERPKMGSKTGRRPFERCNSGGPVTLSGGRTGAVRGGLPGG